MKHIVVKAGDEIIALPTFVVALFIIGFFDLSTKSESHAFVIAMVVFALAVVVTVAVLIYPQDGDWVVSGLVTVAAASAFVLALGAALRLLARHGPAKGT